MMMFTLDEGRAAVRAARQVVDSIVRNVPIGRLDLPKSFCEKGGVFVTLSTYPKKDLRGCIGYPEPVYPLDHALEDAAKSAATRDPRFEPVSTKELEKIVVEVSLLTRPELIKVEDPRDYIKEIRIGRDGLIVECGFSRGLLLPQVPVEWGWDVETFLVHTCRKAGLPGDSWREEGTKVHRFSGQVFDEVEPRGDIIERSLAD